MTLSYKMEFAAAIRRLLAATVSVALVVLLSSASCTGGKDIVERPAVSLDSLRALKESPLVTEKVLSGELPPLADRLPDEPLVIEPLHDLGVYGGVWHFDVVSRRDVNLVYHIVNPSFLRWNRAGTGVEAHFCRAYEVSDDGKLWTFHLRRGVKWSDGHPFTTEDVRFWYEEDALNRDLNPIPLQVFQVGNQFGTLRIVDSLTFQVEFPVANYGFYEKMMGIILFYIPSHYLKQFHERYADPLELAEKLRQSRIKKWSELYIKMDRWQDGYLNPDRPTMRPWILSTRSNSPNTVEFIRNPYYWAVDSEGRQLPYIERVVIHMTSNEQVLTMKTIAGDFDFQWRRLDFKDYPLLKENESKRDYSLLTWPQDRGSDVALYINYNCKDPVAGPLLRNRDFRIALSQAIDRSELNLLFYKNIGKPRQATAAEICEFFNPEYANTYADFDPALADSLLDLLGLTRRDDAGYRLDPQGRPFLLFLETADLNRIDILQIVAEYWQAVGIRAEVKVMEGSLLTQRTQAGEVKIQARPLGSFRPPTAHMRSDYIAPLFGLWHNSLGKQGLEPTPPFKELYQLGDLRRRASVEEEVGLLREIYSLYAEQVWVIGLVGEVPAILAKKNYFMNVPDVSLYSYVRGRRLQLSLPEQYWIDPNRRPN